MDELAAGWRAGSGAQFAASFVAEARFVAFDGTMLTGPAQIEAFHQRAFDSHLRDTELDLTIQEMRPLGDKAWLVFSRSEIKRKDGPADRSIGASVQTFVVRSDDGIMRIEAFQNTRERPIVDAKAAEVWRAFDRLWAERAC